MISKLPNVGTTIFTTVSKAAVEYNAINLGQGFPNFDPHPALLSYVEKYIRDSKHQYAPMPGAIPLLESIAHLRSIYHRPTHPTEEVTVTAGGTQAIFTAIAAMVSPGDEVIVFEPLYDSYIPSIITFGGKPVIVSTYPPYFDIDWYQLKSLINTKTKMIIINTPGNPSGKLWKKEDFERLSELIRDKDIVILSDEVYEYLVFDQKLHISPMDFEELRRRTISVHSFGKTLHCTGWKMGYMVASHHLTVELRKVHQFNVFAVNSFLQYAIADFLTNYEEEIELLPNFYQSKRDFFASGLPENYFPLTTEGSFFTLVDYSAVSELDDVDFNQKIMKDHQVAGIPLSAFYTSHLKGHQFIRFCFAKEEYTLEKALMYLKNG